MSATVIHPEEAVVKTYRIVWARCPWAHNPQRVDFVDAAATGGARMLLLDHIERTQGIPRSDVHIFSNEEYEAPSVLGKVRT